ncbi:tetratricopeptide repeat protein [Streptomyces sp. NPDC005955]|uniref:tetratricopeptide repeat protein n=1 Tax=Streptomyces sp. NPDC005955 TaxID=3364738 RepID=UPI0036A6315F
MSRFSRGGRKRQQSPPPGREGSSASGLRPIEVHVFADGTAVVGGLPVAAAPGESPQDAVLNYLHRLVLATGHPVAAVVHDERIGYSTPLQVGSDGASAFAGPPVPLPGNAAGAPVAPAAAPGALPAVPPPAAAAPPQDGVTTVLRAVPDPAPRPPATAPTPVPEPAPAAPAVPPAHSAAPTPEPVPAGATVPSLLAEPVRRINEAMSMGRIESAAAMAEQSIATASQALGADHPEVLQLRELAAYIAYLAGDLPRSFALSMALARARRRRDDDRAFASVQSAAAAWRALRDPAQGLALGHELIALWSDLAAEGGPAAADTAQLDAVRARMDRLFQRAGASADRHETTGRSHAQGQ